MDVTEEEKAKINTVMKAMWDSIPDHTQNLHVIYAISALMTAILESSAENVLPGISLLASLIIGNLQSRGIDPFEALEQQSSKFKMDKPEPKKWMN